MNPNFGGGNQQLGNTDALRQAMTGRGLNVSVLDQQGSNSAGFTPGLAQPALPNPQASPASTVPQGASSPAAAMGASLGMPTSNTAAENDLIIKALSAKMKSNSEMEKMQAGVQ